MIKFVLNLISSTKALVAGAVSWIVLGTLWYASVEETKSTVIELKQEIRSIETEQNELKINQEKILGEIRGDIKEIKAMIRHRRRVEE